MRVHRSHGHLIDLCIPWGTTNSKSSKPLTINHQDWLFHNFFLPGIELHHNIISVTQGPDESCINVYRGCWAKRVQPRPPVKGPSHHVETCLKEPQSLSQ